MKQKIFNKKIDFHGFWREPRLSGSFWILNKKSHDKELKRYNDFVVDYIYMDGNFFIPTEQIEKINKITNKLLDKNPCFFDKLFSDTEKTIRTYQEIKTLEKHTQSFLLFLKEHKKLIFFWHIYTQLNESLTIYLEKKASGYGNINCLDYVRIRKETISMKENKEFKKLYIAYKNKKQFNIALKRYFNDYEFVGTHAYGGNPQAIKSIMKKLQEYKPEGEIIFLPPKDKFYIENKRVIDIASDAAFYRMFCAENFTRISFLFWGCLKNLAKNYELTFEHLINYSPIEIEDLILTGKKVSNKEIEQRIECPGFVRQGDDLLNFKPDDVRVLLKKFKPDIVANVDILKGMAASRGFAKGIVKIVLHASFLKKLKENEILVAFETTPDYIVAMKKSAAILTEQGGITSHAAIVSREMRKPCIVGIKGITDILKDGDLVEVDAYKGVVRMLKTG